MGQQQLLLLAISLIVVALAVMTGLEAIQQYQRHSAADRLVDRNLSIASTAVAWKTRSDPFAGGNMSYEGLTENGLARLAMNDETSAGRFQILEVTESSFVVIGVSTDYPEIGARTSVSEYTIESTVVNYNGQITLDE